ncbi:MAG: tetratricopeptide repeat protein [Gemmatimonadota bacterium]
MRQFWARRYRSKGNRAEAAKIYREIYEADRTQTRAALAVAAFEESRGRHEEAIQIYRELLEKAPMDTSLLWSTLEAQLRRRLYDAAIETSRRIAEVQPWNGRPLAKAGDISRRQGDLEAAARLYGEALEMSPDDAELWLEWVDFLQVRLADDEAARKALERYGERFGLTPDLSFRLAQLEAWAGRNAEARERLEALIAEDPSRAEAWTLLGDLRRWAGDRPGAADAYRRALALDPQSEQAAAGLAEVRRQTEAVVAAREPEGAGPRAEGFLDSDDYRRFDLAGTSRFRWGVTALRTTAGYRTLRGLDLGGLKRTEEGVFGEVEISHWWREATIRTALSGGLEHLDAFGLEPTFGGLLEIPNADGYAFFARATHGPAYPITRTLESVIEPVYADQLAVSLYHALGARWSVLFVGDATHLAQPAEDNFRWNGGISLSRRLTPALSAGVGSRFLSFGRPATRVGLRRLYWDPSAFWATDVSLALRSPGREGWGYYASLAPGFALIDEREVPGTDLVPQIRTEAGVSFLGERTTFSADLFYGRGRERDYSSFGFELQLSVRPW